MTAPGERRYLAAADLLRVFSVGLVGWFHIWQQSWLDPGFSCGAVWIDLQRIARHGYMPVDLMLLLSGFLLYLPRARRVRAGRESESLRAFYGRRALRILPSYLFCLAVMLAAACAGGPAPGSPPVWADLLAHLTFTQTFFRSTYLWSSFNVVLWTLAVEAQFYLLFPFLARAFARRPALVWGGMTAAALLCRGLLVSREDISVLLNQLPCMLDLYAFGMLAAHLLARWEEKRRLPWLCAAGAAACLAGILLVLWNQHGADNRALQQEQLLWRLPLAALGGGFLLLGGLGPPVLDRALGNPVTRFLSGISYNFYIWHQPVAVWLKKWHIPAYVTEMPQKSEGRLWQEKYTALCFAGALLAAVLATYLVEKPACRLAAALRRREPAREP